MMKSMKKWLESKVGHRFLAIVLFAIPLVFFTIAYLSMSMSGEDVAQANMNSENGLLGIIAWVYSYIPRIGEFITWPVAKVLSYQTSFGLDILVRIIDIVAVMVVIYLISLLSLRRKLKVRLLDAAVFNVVFLLIVLIPQLVSPLFGNPFLSGFSFIHNYVTMSLVALLFILPFVSLFLKLECPKFLESSFTMFVLGFLFAISTELLPVSFVVVAVLYVLYKKIILHEEVRITKWQIFSMVGILVGLGFFYLGGGLSARTGYSYAETYDYISLSSILTSPKYFLVTFLKHFSRNIKYLIPLFSIILLEVVTYKIEKGRSKNGIISLFRLISVFSFIYIVGTSLILLDDAMAARFLLPCYLLLVIVGGIFVADYWRVLIKTDFGKAFVAVVVALFSVIVVADMSIGKIYYMLRTNIQLAEVEAKVNGDEEVCLTKEWAASEAGAVYSPIFSFTQEPIFEPWNVKVLYGHEIVWAEFGEEDFCGRE